MDLETARQVLTIAEAERDPAIRSQLFRVARAYHMRNDGDEHKQRMVVLKVMERAGTIMTFADLKAKTLLPDAVIKSFLDEWTSAAVDLVFITTMRGKRKCGRNGTTLYYGLRG